MKKQKDNNKKRASKILSNAFIILMMLVGFALVLYPTVADKINDSVNKKIITDYQEKANMLDSGEYRKILDEAKAYNEELALTMPYITELKDEQRKEYESLLNLSGTGIMGYVEIKKANIYLAIYHGTDENALQTGAGHLEASSLPVPGESVHTVLAGHSGLPSARLFTDLDRLKIGDTFTLHILGETLTYCVEEIKRVNPDELKTLRIEDGRELCTLMTCTPYGINTHRLVVTGSRIETPTEEKSSETSALNIAASKWNLLFVFIPVILFTVILITVLIIHNKKKRKRLLRASRSEEDPRL